MVDDIIDKLITLNLQVFIMNTTLKVAQKL